MPRPRALPDNQTLERWVAEGLTHDQITDRVYELTGNRVARSTVSVALHRAGISSVRTRHSAELPWRVPVRFAAQYPARMLRLLGRIRHGDDGIPDSELDRFHRWRAWLEENGVCVAFDPDHGFFYARADQPGDYPDGIPIRPGLSRMPEE